MFRNRRISFIIGASLAAVILILQAIPPFSKIGTTFAADYMYAGRGGLALLQASWILLMVFAVLIVIAGAFGALFVAEGKFHWEKTEKYAKIYRIVYNVLLFTLALFCLLILISDGVSILTLMDKGEPEILRESVIITAPGIYIAFLIAYAMPTASYVRKFKKQQS